MTDNAAGLNDILTALRSGRFGQREVWEGHLIEAISRLTTPPPDEIAALIARLELENPRLDNAITLYGQAAIALRAQAQEIERLKGDAAGERQFNDAMRDQNVRFAKRIRELEAENERLKATDWSDIGAVSILKGRIRELEAELKFALAAHDGQAQDKDTIAGWLAKAEAERDAIRRKTIEECAKAVEHKRWPPNQKYALELSAFGAAIEAIRALAHSEGGKEKS